MFVSVSSVRLAGTLAVQRVVRERSLLPDSPMALVSQWQAATAVKLKRKSLKETRGNWVDFQSKMLGLTNVIVFVYAVFVGIEY